MKKNLLFGLIMSFAVVSGLAQSQNASIKGKLLTSEGEIVPFATVILLDKDSILVKADVTKEDGYYHFAGLDAGSYRVGVRDLQYRAYLTEPMGLKSGQHLEVPDITVQADVKELEGVQVTASKPLVDVQPNKTVFNVASSVNASGNDGMELLRKAPGVVIDNNDNIILQGKNGVRIYIDGKPSPLRGEDLVAMLRSMQSDQIESIEIITNPSAKYDAEGNAGIIDIKLKRDKNLGMNATLSGNYSTGIRENYQTALNFNYRNKTTNFFGNYSWYDNEGEQFVRLNKQLNGNFLNQIGTITNDNSGHNFRGGVDYFINKKHTIGIVANGSITDRSINNVSSTPIGDLQTGEVAEILQANNLRNFETDNVNLNFNYQYKGEKGNSFNLDADYGYFWNDGNVYQPNQYFDPSGEVVQLERNFANDQLTRIDIKTLKGDYETNLAKGRLSAGFKYSNVNTENDFDFFNMIAEERIRDLTRSNAFSYKEKVSAAYTSYFRKLSDKFSVNAGLRVEHTESDGRLESTQENENDRVKRSYTDLFPSGGLTYQLDQSNKFSFNYSRRIDRPSYQDLNPFEFKLDELTFSRGNPFLNPQYTHSVQVTHTHKYKLNTTLAYSITNDFFAQVTDTTGTLGSLLEQRNIADATNISINVSYPFDVAKWWSAFGNFNLYHVTYDANFEGVEIDLDATAYNIYLQNNFILPKGIKLELSGWYNSPGIWGGTFVTESMWSLDLGVKKSIWQDRAQLRVGVSDIFKSQKWSGYSDYGGLRVDGNGGFDSRRLRLGFTYQLGNRQVKASRKRKTGMEEESKRIKEGE